MIPLKIVQETEFHKLQLQQGPKSVIDRNLESPGQMQHKVAFLELNEDVRPTVAIYKRWWWWWQCCLWWCWWSWWCCCCCWWWCWWCMSWLDLVIDPIVSINSAHGLLERCVLGSACKKKTVNKQMSDDVSKIEFNVMCSLLHSFALHSRGANMK